MNLNETVLYGGRRYAIVGFDPMSVDLQRVYLRDLETGDEITPLLTDLLHVVHIASSRSAEHESDPHET